MKFVYASRMGHVEGIIKRVGIEDALKIQDGTEYDIKEIKTKLSSLK